ncbi:hypothetical protein IAQ61_004946 [Plenodomus lingam]|uniref:Predicted protein n=1 Tax=Leptosphaeria maculans (strain JN3 / isolate v23.1.3 / race Av1-4-5-6-7-8) TaxID=985895 RepID=E4ZTA4_LEPMJ|nr:predicted protein [Plenodomus lingam JN3]KAH9872546.1 hypothetical protein IAQ61_004946 [Plenodomus lingam]CBX90046.1 predicted protein [Plenodomus lingam JN3]
MARDLLPTTRIGYLDNLLLIFLHVDESRPQSSYMDEPRRQSSYMDTTAEPPPDRFLPKTPLDPRTVEERAKLHVKQEAEIQRVLPTAASTPAATQRLLRLYTEQNANTIRQMQDQQKEIVMWQQCSLTYHREAWKFYNLWQDAHTATKPISTHNAETDCLDAAANSANVANSVNVADAVDVVDVVHEHERKLIEYCFTALHELPLSQYEPKEGGLEMWIKFNEWFQTLRRLCEIQPASVKLGRLNEPELVRGAGGDPEWQQHQERIDARLLGKGQAELLILLDECMQEVTLMKEEQAKRADATKGNA